MTDIVLLYCTTSTVAEAEAIARKVVGERLAACANIIPGMRSVYWWQGKLEQGEEAVLILKTGPDLVDAATAAVKAAHSYSVPCVLSLPVGQGGNAEYIAWLLAETKR
ncbi:divalent-cation tolerance protein CutA [Ferrovibrio terrae]|uniref:Divalent-cation tolerance protein CutA n=1 Tax=Ferrovibrio terrae TaxID=2594003 RepID=A0A516H4C6_9PROT|nr:divalent-cation tolerance protein CutA [Ferrovibrio terrae]QDO98607.1 divalent-cation tolerance protein CutA [Ferrovibrio terrae]